MGNRLLKIQIKNVVEKLVPHLLTISLDLQSKILYGLFLFHVQVKDYQNILGNICKVLTT